MKNCNQELSTFYVPFKAMLFYRSEGQEQDCYVEAYDVSVSGKLKDPHPLSLNESQKLGELLLTTERLSDHYLQPNGIFPPQVLYTKTGQQGFAIWYTPATHKRLLFLPGLGLKDGDYPLPAMVWKADREHLQVFALREDNKPDLSTQLYLAPFFNIYQDGKVCMGTVDISIERNTCLESFINQWEDYFFNSKFSHVLGERAPTKSNIITLWKSLCNSRKCFPKASLQKHSFTLKNLIA